MTGPTRGARFVVSLSQQTCWLYQNGALTNTWRCSTGPRARTITGNFAVRSKLSRLRLRLGLLDALLVGDLHGRQLGERHPRPALRCRERRQARGNVIGTPISFGCVVLSDAAAARLFSVAYIGMPVRIIP